MQSNDLQNGQKLKQLQNNKNTPGSITTSKLGQKAKNLQSLKQKEQANSNQMSNNLTSTSMNGQIIQANNNQSGLNSTSNQSVHR